MVRLVESADFVARHHQRRSAAQHKPHQQPRQPPRHAPQRRVFQRVPGVGALAQDAGEPMQVLAMLAGQHGHQHHRREAAERLPVRVDHGKGGDPGRDRRLGRVLLVGLRGDLRPARAHQRSEPGVGRSGHHVPEVGGSGIQPTGVEHEDEIERLVSRTG